MQKINLAQAAEVWYVAHALLQIIQGGETTSLNNAGNGGRNDSMHVLDWCCNIRKLVLTDLETYLMDHVYGDTFAQPTSRNKRNAIAVLRRFKDRLAVNPDVYCEYPRFRDLVLGA